MTAAPTATSVSAQQSIYRHMSIKLSSLYFHLPRKSFRSDYAPRKPQLIIFCCYLSVVCNAYTHIINWMINEQGETQATVVVCVQ